MLCLESQAVSQSKIKVFEERKIKYYIISLLITLLFYYGKLCLYTFGTKCLLTLKLLRRRQVDVVLMFYLMACIVDDALEIRLIRGERWCLLLKIIASELLFSSFLENLLAVNWVYFQPVIIVVSLIQKHYSNYPLIDVIYLVRSLFLVRGVNRKWYCFRNSSWVVDRNRLNRSYVVGFTSTD